LVLLPIRAVAGEAEDVAVATHEIRQKYCAEAATGKNTAVAIALKEIMPVFVQVSEVYDRTGEHFLLYWRGVLQECIGQEDLAQQDLDSFLASEKAVGDFPDLARDARRRLRRMDSTAKRKLASAETKRKPALFVLGLGLGFQEIRQIGADLDEHGYAMFPVDLSVRLVGPLRLVAYTRIGISDRYSTINNAHEQFDAEDFRSILLIFGLGIEVRIETAVLPRFGALLQLAPNPEYDELGLGAEEAYGGAFLVGVAGTVGVDIPLGTRRFLLRPQIEVGVLSTLFSFRLSAAFAIAFP
jgi:hypothetical protein